MPDRAEASATAPITGSQMVFLEDI